MVAYVVVTREEGAFDADQFALYAQKAKIANVAHPMTVLARRGRMRIFEGPRLAAMSILQFPTFEAAQAWYMSAAYQEALPFRLKSGKFSCVIIEGL
jgi:uncharacterized protein (DUF1330 family)